MEVEKPVEVTPEEVLAMWRAIPCCGCGRVGLDLWWADGDSWCSDCIPRQADRVCRREELIKRVVHGTDNAG